MTIEKFLIKKGFKEAAPYEYAKKTFYAKLPTDQWCKCNDKPPSLVVSIFDIQDANFKHQSCSFEIRALPKENGEWIDFKFYSVPIKTAMAEYDSLVMGLVRAWEAVVK